MKWLWRSEHGFTIVEALLGLSILSVVMTGMGAALFHAVRAQDEVVDDGLAINELRKGFSWFTEDAKMARATDLTDGAPPASSATFSWTDAYQGAGISHTVSYGLIGDRLVRTYDGKAHTVAHRVLSVSFSRTGQVITALAQVNAKPGQPRTLSIQAVMRPTP